LKRRRLLAGEKSQDIAIPDQKAENRVNILVLIEEPIGFFDHRAEISAFGFDSQETDHSYDSP